MELRWTQLAVLPAQKTSLRLSSMSLLRLCSNVVSPLFPASVLVPAGRSVPDVVLGCWAGSRALGVIERTGKNPGFNEVWAGSGWHHKGIFSAVGTPRTAVEEGTDRELGPPPHQLTVRAFWRRLTALPNISHPPLDGRCRSPTDTPSHALSLPLDRGKLVTD